MICTFFGHRDAPDSLKDVLSDTVWSLILKEGVKTFYVGNNGNFDFLVQRLLVEIKRQRKDISYTVVLSRIDEVAVASEQSETIFPDGLEKVPGKFAISRRNDWLIKHSDYVITYTKRKYSNCYNWIEKAAKKGLKIINAADANF